ncbi:hypothetical protein HAX54_001768 [Datura stramonium]|uniref:Uncharacterized protein n=1 Tax=Datura stramonium TaxID=4076 RepID=A0ABS8T4C1_DATST|nr:hypothetical protein [Datura stramonium]
MPHLTYEEVVGAGLRTMKFAFIFLRAPLIFSREAKLERIEQMVQLHQLFLFIYFHGRASWHGSALAIEMEIHTLRGRIKWASAKPERARRRKGQTLRPNGNEQRRNEKMSASGTPFLEKEGRRFWACSFPRPPSSGGACVEGAPPEIGLRSSPYQQAES